MRFGKPRVASQAGRWRGVGSARECRNVTGTHRRDKPVSAARQRLARCVCGAGCKRDRRRVHRSEPAAAPEGYAGLPAVRRWRPPSLDGQSAGEHARGPGIGRRRHDVFGGLVLGRATAGPARDGRNPEQRGRDLTQPLVVAPNPARRVVPQLRPRRRSRRLRHRHLLERGRRTGRRRRTRRHRRVRRGVRLRRPAEHDDRTDKLRRHVHALGRRTWRELRRVGLVRVDNSCDRLLTS